MNEGSVKNSSEEEKVRALYEQLMDGWNLGSGEAFARVFAEDGHLVAFDGTHFRGRREIEPFHQELFDKWLRGSRLVGRVENVAFQSPDVAVMHAVGGTIMRGKTEPSPERDSIQTLVAVRGEDGEWKIQAFQNTRVHSMNAGTASFLIWTLSDALRRLFGPGKPRRQG